ncbi:MULTISPECIES: hypothetical protein [Streptomyces]|uniref:Uncharacterized protein n=1 Tax=Streptomyces siderophoricus TaxID=2802281 RepID=A0ABS1MJG8_9ACTN|nr:hypothetical protein [Streptomyces sp. 9-7]MBL1087807.1 hypothetical protein [Streptomyces sp. 9-7]
MEHLRHEWPWYALALVGAYRLTATGLDALVRRVVRAASQARAEHPSAPARPYAGPAPRGPLGPYRPRPGAFPDVIPPPLRPTAGSRCEESR